MTAGPSLLEGTNVTLQFSEEELALRQDHIASFITETVEAAGATGSVIGLSGGIDSTVVAYLAVDALGADAVHGLLLPSAVNPDEDTSDAERVVDALGISHDVIEIEPIVDTFLETVPSRIPDDTVAVGNLRVRTRALLLYYYSNADDRVVLGTGNRAEAATGYFTKYGDQAVDCNPIGNLYKCQVRQLAREMGVPDDIVTRTPTAGMWRGQTDEEEMGLGYDALDAILALHIDGPFSRAATIQTLDVPPDAIDRVVDLYQESRHKRAMPPAPDPRTPP